MGEYATYNGNQIKIGTCEDMYYLRYDQRRQVTRERGSVDPVEDAEVLRFRFPWPDEDGNDPGNFDNFHRAIAVPGFVVPADVEHTHVQFVAQAGYNVCLPCPESTAYTQVAKHGALKLNDSTHTINVHRNGYAGSALLVAQKFRAGIGLVPILKCGGCGSMWRVEDRSTIEEIAVLFRSEGDRYPTDARRFHEIADRILAGINGDGE